MNRGIVIASSLVVVLLSGCATRTRETSSSVVQYLYPKGGSAAVQEGPVTLTLPATVGIAFVPPGNGSSQTYGTAPFVGGALGEAQQQALLDKVAQHFRKYKFIKRIDTIPQSYLAPGGGWTNLSAVSRMYGDDIIALVSYDQVQTTNEDALSLTYLTIVGAYVIPGEKNSTSTFVDTTVFDARTRRLLFRAPGISRVHGRSALVGASGALQQQSRAGYGKAVDGMIVNLDDALGKFKDKVKQSPSEYRVQERGQPAGGGGGTISPVVLALLGLAVFVAALRRRRPG